MKKQRALFGICAALIVGALSGCIVVEPGHNAMKFKRWGKGLITDKVYSNGPVWRWAWVDVISYNTQWQTYTETLSVLTEDELHIDMTISLTLRPILSELQQLELEVGRDYYKSVVRPEFLSITRNIFSKYPYSDVSPKGPEIEAMMLKMIKDEVVGKHLEFDNVTIVHIKYPELVNSAVDRKLAVEQDIEQKDYEMEIATKNAEIQRILARGQRDAQAIIDSSITREYLQYKALEVQDKLATSPNAKFYFVPLGKDGLPVIIDSGASN
jgi:regulator of protease activity HflC (stomatin/prohibitin superfamily)